MGRLTLSDLTGKNALSYSSYSTFLECGEKYRLTRIHRVDQEQSFWLVGGSAFHEASEAFDRGDSRGLPVLWQEAWQRQLAELDRTKPIRAGGRATKAYPNKEDDSWWGINGPIMLENYARWRDQSGWQLLEVDGHLFVEYEFSLLLKNPIQADDASEDIVIQGFIDRVFVTDMGEVVICDLKTGSREPTATQLGIYAAGLRQRAKIDAPLGVYMMARKGEPGRMHSMLQYTDNMLGYWFGMAEDAIRSERFLPHVSSMCGTCMVAAHCYAVGGKSPTQLPFETKVSNI